MSPLEKVVFEKNMCLADTSVRGKSGKWHFFKWVHSLIIGTKITLICNNYTKNSDHDIPGMEANTVVIK